MEHLEMTEMVNFMLCVSYCDKDAASITSAPPRIPQLRSLKSKMLYSVKKGEGVGQVEQVQVLKSDPTGPGAGDICLHFSG